MKRMKSEGVADLLDAYRRLQFVAPPVSDGKTRTHDMGFIEFSPGKGEWPVSLAANLVEEQSADGTRSWPFSISEDTATREILIRNLDGRVIYTLASEDGYDPEWVFRGKFRIDQSTNKAEAYLRYKRLFDPSRVVMTGRLVPATEPEGQDTDISMWSSVEPLEMQRSLVLNEISTNTPGFPPTGYKDGLYLKQGSNGTNYIFQMGANLRSITSASSCSLLLFSDDFMMGMGYDPRTYNPCAPSMETPVNAVFSLPEDITNVKSITVDYSNYFFFLKNDGHVRAWGQEDNAFGRGDVPSSVTNAVSVVAGGFHAAALKSNGKLVEWGATAGIPAAATNVDVTAIAAGWCTTLALRQDKTVVEWDCVNGQTLSVPASVVNAVAIAAGFSHSLALLEDGSVVAWGNNYCFQTNVPASVVNAVAIAAGWDHSMALLQNGHVVVWGDNFCGQTNIPDSVSDVVGIRANGTKCHALLRDGSAVVWGGGVPGGCPQQPLSTLGADGLCRILQTAYSEEAGDGLLLGLARVPENLFSDGWPNGDVITFDDADGDGLFFFDEMYRFGTDPETKDSDHDGIDDGAETIAPFITLWDRDDRVGVAFVDAHAVQVVASSSARAARLIDGRVLIFTGSGTGLKVYTNECNAAEIDATDAWIAARLTDGNVKIWREVAGTVSETSMGYTNAKDISGGAGHMLVLYENGKVNCLRPKATTGAPETNTTSFCSYITNARMISAGSAADAVLLDNNYFRFGNALTSSSTLKLFTGSPNPVPVDVAAGTNNNYVVLFSNGWATAYKQSSGTQSNTPPGVVRIAAGGDSQLLAVFSNGSNGVFTAGGTTWSYTQVTNNLLNARNLWWTRDSRMAVSATGELDVMKNATNSERRLDYLAVAVTPGGFARAIALACSATCPTNAFSDSDIMSDGWEAFYGLNPNDSSDAGLDSDGDGLLNSNEFIRATSPRVKDSDGDGYQDGWEHDNGFDPADPYDTGIDSDGDGLPDGQEVFLGSNRNKTDSDEDGLSDGMETEAPFLVLWEPESRTGRVVFCRAEQVTASDDMRAALIVDGGQRAVVIFSEGDYGPSAVTNQCDAAEIDATDRWIVARQNDGDVRIWWRSLMGLKSVTVGIADAGQISCGYGHLLIKHSDGSVSCLKADGFGTPAFHDNLFCSDLGSEAVRVAAGFFSDLALMQDGTLRMGDALGTLSQTPRISSYSSGACLSSGTNSSHLVLETNGVATAFNGNTKVSSTLSGVSYIVADGSMWRLAVMANGANATLASGASTWSYNTVVSDDLRYVRDLWWRRGSRISVGADGGLLSLGLTAACLRSMDYYRACLTPGLTARGIAVACSKTLVMNPDSDGDGLKDGWEVKYGFNPRSFDNKLLDSDGDGLIDEQECVWGTNPFSKDTDGDGMPDKWEATYNLAPLDPSDAFLDPDNDGWSNAEEFLRGTNPTQFDGGSGYGTVIANTYDDDDRLRSSTPGTGKGSVTITLSPAGNQDNIDERKAQ